jgi:catechol 2,3-dioxygenase-like lactoylglutathione lyase family enzyme
MGKTLKIVNVIAQLRTTDLAASIDFYTNRLGFTLEFEYDDFYAGLRAGDNMIHLKLVDEADPSIEFVEHGGHFHLYLQTDDIVAVADQLRHNRVSFERDVHDTEWGTRELIVKDDQGHTLYFAQSLPA